MPNPERVNPIERIADAISQLGYQHALPGQTVPVGFENIATRARIPVSQVRQALVDSPGIVWMRLPSGWRVRVYPDRAFVEITRKGVTHGN